MYDSVMKTRHNRIHLGKSGRSFRLKQARPPNF